MCYFNNVFKYPSITIDAICHALNDPKFDRVDLIVGTGMSGAIVLIPVSIQSSIPCAAIRKKSDTNTSHSNRRIETFIPRGYKVYRYVIIDDFIKSGNTITQIIETMTALYTHCKCVGIILYQDFCTTDKMWNGTPFTRLGKDIVELNEIRHKEGILV